NDIYSLNDTTTVCSRKSSPSYDEKSSECLNRNSNDQNIDQEEEKSKITENDFPSRESSINQSFQRSLTPSLDPKLLKQFEEEDRPKRVLRSSTLPKITIISDKSTTKLISPNFTIKMAAKKSTNKKSIVKNTKRKKSEKFSNNNFTIATNTFPVENVFYSTRLNDGIKRKRLQSKDGNKETENLRNKRLRAEIGGLFGDKLMMSLENLRNTPIRSRHWSGASSSRASTSSSSNEFTVITKMAKKRGSSRELSRNRRNSFNSNWKLTGSPYESFIYVDKIIDFYFKNFKF
ncbi:unnamed protein product, partial [Onchocerca ochengi]|uniref:Uncharacterized protein n=1 Tax=Onchocerca ochengi TaxID=42157 RepID=A0A182EV84_ONCOC